MERPDDDNLANIAGKKTLQFVQCTVHFHIIIQRKQKCVFAFIHETPLNTKFFSALTECSLEAACHFAKMSFDERNTWPCFFFFEVTTFDRDDKRSK